MTISSPDVSRLFTDILLEEPRTFALRDVGLVSAAGPLLATLDGDDNGLAHLGLTATMRRAGFQAHDGQIFQRLLARGGVLVAILSEPRAADGEASFIWRWQRGDRSVVGPRVTAEASIGGGPASN